MNVADRSIVILSETGEEIEHRVSQSAHETSKGPKL